MAKELAFAQQIKHPKWQKKRLEILERDNFKCRSCNDDSEEEIENESQLHVHHFLYKKGYNLWDYENYHLITLCEQCHNRWHINNDEIKEYLCVLPEKQMSIYNLLSYTNQMTEYEIDKLSEMANIILMLR